MKERAISKSDIKDINKKFYDKYEIELFGKKDNIRFVEGEFNYYKKDGFVLLVDIEGILIPTLKLLLENNFLPKVTCDMGAVKFLCKGADLMKPGILNVEEFGKGSIVSVVDENNGKPIAICRALYSSEEIQDMKEGKVLENLHFVGDDLWNL